MPPVRLSFIRTILHPDFSTLLPGGRRCPDPDCLTPNTCLGNSLVLIDDGAEDNAAPTMGRGSMGASGMSGMGSGMGGSGMGGSGGMVVGGSGGSSSGGRGNIMMGMDGMGSGGSGGRDDGGGGSGSGGGGGGGVFEQFGYGRTSILSRVVHSKNDRRPSHEPMQYRLPSRGPLPQLLLTHIKAGHKLLTQRQNPTGMPRLFVSRQGQEFNSSTLTQWWATLMRDNPRAESAGVKYFAPNQGRTIFVEEYVTVRGVLPEMMDGAAAVMGTSVGQWRASYNPSRRGRAAQLAIDGHMAYRPLATPLGAAGGVEEAEAGAG